MTGKGLESHLGNDGGVQSSIHGDDGWTRVGPDKCDQGGTSLA